MRTRISSVRDLKGLPWTKGRLLDKVVEILETGRLEKLEAKRSNPRLQALVALSRIWGVGPATAASLYKYAALLDWIFVDLSRPVTLIFICLSAGYKSLGDLRARGQTFLSEQQQIGLKYYQDFLTKIPRLVWLLLILGFTASAASDPMTCVLYRPEVTEIERTVVDEVHRLIPHGVAFACGSYRRGKQSSGDCDVLITDPNADECDIMPGISIRFTHRESVVCAAKYLLSYVWTELLHRLHASGFLTGFITEFHSSGVGSKGSSRFLCFADDLTQISKHREGKSDSYMGVCQLSKDLPHRRLDIKVYPRHMFGFALLYFTGSDHFNRSMRLFARMKGYSLSDKALKRVVRANGKKLSLGESVICTSEVDVFIALGLDYKDPLERNCFDIRFLEEDEANAKRGGSAKKTTADDNGLEDDEG